MIQNFGVKEPLSAVRLYVEMHRTDGDGPFKLMTSFPRKVFSTEDYDKPLETLGKISCHQDYLLLCSIIMSKC